MTSAREAKPVEKKRAEAGDLEREIDRRVYALYGLTPAEIKIVEESAQK